MRAHGENEKPGVIQAGGWWCQTVKAPLRSAGGEAVPQGRTKGQLEQKDPGHSGEKGEEERILHEGPEALGQHWGLWLGALDMI